MQASQAGPRRPGDVIDQSAFTGTSWVPLPAGWWPDPTGRHQFRWWTGAAWSQSAMTSERPFVDPLPQSGPPSPLYDFCVITAPHLSYSGQVDARAFWTRGAASPVPVALVPT